MWTSPSFHPVNGQTSDYMDWIVNIGHQPMYMNLNIVGLQKQQRLNLELIWMSRLDGADITCFNRIMILKRTIIQTVLMQFTSKMPKMRSFLGYLLLDK